VKLLDFGLAKSIGGRQRGRKTAGVTGAGIIVRRDVHYMGPISCAGPPPGFGGPAPGFDVAGICGPSP